jgi:hypothetical protein
VKVQKLEDLVKKLESDIFAKDEEITRLKAFEGVNRELQKKKNVIAQKNNLIKSQQKEVTKVQKLESQVNTFTQSNKD